MPDEITSDEIPPGFKLRHTLRGHKDVIHHIAWSPDGRRLASGGRDGAVQIWDAVGGELRRNLISHPEENENTKWDWSFEVHYRSIYGVSWSPNGRTLASCGDEAIWLWDTRTWQLRRTLGERLKTVVSVAWSPDGRTLAAGSDDFDLRLWDAETVQTKIILDA